MSLFSNHIYFINYELKLIGEMYYYRKIQKGRNSRKISRIIIKIRTIC